MSNATQFELYVRPVSVPDGVSYRYRCLLLAKQSESESVIPARGTSLRLKLGDLCGHFLPAPIGSDDQKKFPSELISRPSIDERLEIRPFASLDAIASLFAEKERPQIPALADALQRTKQSALGLFLAYLHDSSRDTANGLLDHYLGAIEKQNKAQLVLCSSECVFEISAKQPLTFGTPDLSTGVCSIAEGVSIGEGEKAESLSVFVPPSHGNTEPDIVPLLVQQTPDGVELEIRTLSAIGEQKLAPSQHWVRLHRADGLTAPASLPMVRAYLLDAKATGVRIVDPLPPGMLLGKQLHYRMDVVNLVGKVLCSGFMTLLRERLDPPSPPIGPTATLDVAGEDVSVEISCKLAVSATGLQERLNLLQLVLFAEERALDECGFYGDDDDRALWESLVAAELCYEGDVASLASVLPGSLAGRYDEMGLRLIARKTVSEIKDKDKDELKWHLGRSDLAWLTPGRGYRLHLRVSRVVRSAPEPKSALVRCTHQLRLPETELTKVPSPEQPVFQLENFWSQGIPESRALPLSRWRTTVVPGTADAPSTVLLSIQHPSGSNECSPDARPIGGYRIWWRDVVAEGELTPSSVRANGVSQGNPASYEQDMKAMSFFSSDTYAVLPEHIAGYQPVQMESGGGWGLIKEKVLDAGVRLRSPTDAANKEDHLANRMRWFKEWITSQLTDLKKLSADPGAEDVVKLRERSAEGPGISTTADPTKTIAEQVSFLLSVTCEKKDGKEQAAAPSSTPAEVAGTNWSIHSRHLTILRELGYCQDIVVPKSEWSLLPKLIERFFGSASVPLWPSDMRAYVVLGRCGDEHKVPLATIRLGLIPDANHPFYLELAKQLKLPEGKNPFDDTAQKGLVFDTLQPLLNSGKGICQLLLVEDRSPSPLFVTMDAKRHVDIRWRELTDQWHHDLEFEIECLDRYDRLLHRLNPSIFAPHRTDSSAPQDASSDTRQRRAVTVPRIKELKDVPFVIPVLHEDQTRVAFHVMDSRERFAAAATVLSRVRSGTHVLHLATSYTRSKADFERYDGLDPLSSDVTSKLFGDLDPALVRIQHELGWHPQPGNPHRRYFFQMTTKQPESSREDDTSPSSLSVILTAGQDTLVPLPNADVMELPDAPYYLTYQLEAWLSADAIQGPSSKAEKTRTPGGLGLTECPRTLYLVYPEGGSSLEIYMRPAMLASHLTEQEWRASEWTRMGRSATWHRLPDLDLCYHFWINVGDEQRRKLQPLLSMVPIRRSSEVGSSDLSAARTAKRHSWRDHYACQNYLGDQTESVPLTRRSSSSHLERLSFSDCDSDGLHITVRVETPQRHRYGRVFEVIRKAAGGQIVNRLFMTLERGSQQTSEPLPLPLDVKLV